MSRYYILYRNRNISSTETKPNQNQTITFINITILQLHIPFHIPSIPITIFYQQTKNWYQTLNHYKFLWRFQL